MQMPFCHFYQIFTSAQTNCVCLKQTELVINYSLPFERFPLVMKGFERGWIQTSGLGHNGAEKRENHVFLEKIGKHGRKLGV